MKKSFSLIELLISLVIISLILAAFVPLITKKLKASDVTVGSFGSNGIGVRRNVTKEDCYKLNAVYVPQSNNVPKPLCVLKYNMGDLGNENWSGVQRCQAGSDCTVEGGGTDVADATEDTLQPTCWQGTTAVIGSCNDAFGGYDGCTRAVCNWTGAKKMCSNYSTGGISGWRLPTYDELTAFTDEKYSSDKLGAEGLMFCDYKTSTVAPMCLQRNPDLGACTGSWYGSCNAHLIWSSSILPDSPNIAQDRYLSARWLSRTHYLGTAMSARCVLDSITDNVDVLESSDDELDSQSDCDRLGAGLLFVPKSATGTKNMCVTKYNIGDMKNETWTGVQNCQAGGECTIEGTEDTNAVTQDTLQPTCWQGNTANSTYCDSKFGGYSGCTRTVCNWTGANKMCENYRLGTYGWRLPTIGELISFRNYNYSNATLTNTGLMFCEHSTTSTTAPLCHHLGHSTVCAGALEDGGCYPDIVWSSNVSSSTPLKAQFIALRGSWSSGSHALNYAFSARCVLDEDAFKHAFTNKIMPSETELSSACSSGCKLCAKNRCYVCDKGYELINDKCVNVCTSTSGGVCTSCTKGYVLLNGKCLSCTPSNGFVKAGNLCVMQYNIGDGYYSEKWNGIQRCIAGSECTVENGKNITATEEKLTATCWQGTTADSEKCNNAFGGYDGCTRTVCNFSGAKKMCENIGWRLPTFNELTSFTNKTYSSNTLAGNGLMLCDYNTGTSNAPMCNILSGDCTGSYYNGDCAPYAVWTSSIYVSASNVLTVSNRHLYNNIWQNGTTYLNTPVSTRCVKDL